MTEIMLAGPRGGVDRWLPTKFPLWNQKVCWFRYPSFIDQFHQQLFCRRRDGRWSQNLNVPSTLVSTASTSTAKAQKCYFERKEEWLSMGGRFEVTYECNFVIIWTELIFHILLFVFFLQPSTPNLRFDYLGPLATLLVPFYHYPSMSMWHVGPTNELSFSLRLGTLTSIRYIRIITIYTDLTEYILTMTFGILGEFS